MSDVNFKKVTNHVLPRSFPDEYYARFICKNISLYVSCKVIFLMIPVKGTQAVL